MRFDQKIAMLCERRGWNQSDLARAVGDVSKNTVSRWFNGAVRPFDETALKLARVLEVSLDYLADDSLDEPPGQSEPATTDPALLDIIRIVGADEAKRRIIASSPHPLVPDIFATAVAAFHAKDVEEATVDEAGTPVVARIVFRSGSAMTLYGGEALSFVDFAERNYPELPRGQAGPVANPGLRNFAGWDTENISLRDISAFWPEIAKRIEKYTDGRVHGSMPLSLGADGTLFIIASHHTDFRPPHDRDWLKRTIESLLEAEFARRFDVRIAQEYSRPPAKPKMRAVPARAQESMGREINKRVEWKRLHGDEPFPLTLNEVTAIWPALIRGAGRRLGASLSTIDPQWISVEPPSTVVIRLPHDFRWAVGLEDEDRLRSMIEEDLSQLLERQVTLRLERAEQEEKKAVFAEDFDPKKGIEENSPVVHPEYGKGHVVALSKPGPDQKASVIFRNYLKTRS